jgi:adenylosuccinate lyase
MIERYSRPQMRKVWSEESKFDKWLKVELAVCEAWAELGVIPAEDIPKIRSARYDRGRIREILEETRHDMTAFLGSVAENLGPESRFVHLGLTSSDVMDTALSLQLVEAADLLAEDISALIGVLKERAVEHKDTLMMGRTHGVHAEPTTFGLKLALWVEEMKRNQDRLTEARKGVAVGKISGAVGTYATVPPAVERAACAKLSLQAAPISSQVLHELCERICGLARLVRGHALTSMENIALWHERDISHSSAERIILPDACLVLDYVLSLFTSVMSGLRVHAERMRQNVELTGGLIFSQRVLLALIEKGLGRQQAYELVQRNAMKAWEEGLELLPLLKGNGEVSAQLSPAELESIFDYGYYLRYVDEVFQRLGLMAGGERPER